jgi:hypothetical protein
MTAVRHNTRCTALVRVPGCRRCADDRAPARWIIDELSVDSTMVSTRIHEEVGIASVTPFHAD